VNWKLWIAVGALAGGAFWAARRRNNRVNADPERWAAATDPVARFGDA
jgi:hypothetical protein